MARLFPNVIFLLTIGMLNCASIAQEAATDEAVDADKCKPVDYFFDRPKTPVEVFGNDDPPEFSSNDPVEYLSEDFSEISESEIKRNSQGSVRKTFAVWLLTYVATKTHNIAQGKTPEGLSYLYRKPKNGSKTWVIQHGVFAGSIETWFPFIGSIPREDGIIAIDALGHGSSEYDRNADYSILVQIDRVKSGLKYIQGQDGFIGSPMIGVAHSLGAIFLQRIAITNPHMFENLIFINPAFLVSKNGEFETMLNNRPGEEGYNPFFPKDYKEILKTMALLVPKSELYCQNPSFLKKHVVNTLIYLLSYPITWVGKSIYKSEEPKMRTLWNTMFPSIDKIFEIYNLLILPDLKNMKISQLYFLGLDDGIFPYSKTEEFIMKNTDQKWIQIRPARGGHLTPILHPQDTYNEIKLFLESDGGPISTLAI